MKKKWKKLTWRNNRSKFQPNIELEPLLQRIQSQKRAIAEAARLQLAEVVVERALCAVLADKAALDQRGAFGRRRTHAGNAAAV